MKSIILVFLASIVTSFAQTNASDNVSSPNITDSATNTGSLEDIEQSNIVYEFYRQRANTESLSNLFSRVLLDLNSVSFSNSLRKTDDGLIVQNIFLSKTNLGPVVLTNSEGTVMTNAFIFRTSFDHAFYRLPSGGGKIKLNDLPVELQKQFGYNPEVAMAVDFLGFRKKMKVQEDAILNAPIATLVPPQTSNVDRAIRAAAEKQWPDNYEMQDFEIKQQAEAYSWVYDAGGVPGVPSDVFDTVKNNAVNEWPDNYVMQKFEINQQCEAYLRLH